MYKNEHQDPRLLTTSLKSIFLFLWILMLSKPPFTPPNIEVWCARVESRKICAKYHDFFILQYSNIRQGINVESARFVHNFISELRYFQCIAMTLLLRQTKNANYVWNALRSKNVTFKFGRRWEFPFYRFGSCKKNAQFCPKKRDEAVLNAQHFGEEEHSMKSVFVSFSEL